jgi:hypothetical protein
MLLSVKAEYDMQLANCVRACCSVRGGGPASTVTPEELPLPPPLLELLEPLELLLPEELEEVAPLELDVAPPLLPPLEPPAGPPPPPYCPPLP